MSPASPEHVLVLYDGVCGLCNAFVQFLLKRDRSDQFRFAALQSPLGRRLVLRHGGSPDTVHSVYLIEKMDHPEERSRTQAKAALFALSLLGGGWKVLGALRIFPAPLLNLGYRLVARFRYRIWGKLDACPIPSQEQRDKFLE